MEITKIYHSPFYEVILHKYSDDKNCVISFDSWYEYQGFDVGPFGKSFLHSKKLNFVSINASTNEWYNEADFDNVVTAILEHTHGFRKIGYGSSMGGHGTLNYYKKLGLSDAVIFCPQFSINLDIVPWEHRWAKEAEQINFRVGDILMPKTVGKATIIYDPFDQDKIHVDLIKSLHNVILFPVPFSGHDPAMYLKKNGCLSSMIMDLFNCRFDAIEYRRRIRNTRRLNSRHWLNVSKHLWMRGLRHRAVEAGKMAASLESDHSEEFAHYHNIKNLLENE